MPHPLDHENMEQVITDSPQQFRDGIAAAAGLTWTPPVTPRDMCLAGMGGSWMAGALLRDTGVLRVPLAIHRAYGLPETLARDTLVILSSFSGNTEETLSAYDEARQRNMLLVAISAGGELEQRSQTDGVPFLKIPANPPTMQPRSATGYTVGILAALATRLGLAAPDLPDRIADLAAYLESFLTTARTRGEAVAPTLAATTPVVYAPEAYATVAMIWKIKINENAKTPAFWNVFPELNHNEMIGWSSPHGPFHALFLRDESEHPRILKRMAITEELLRTHGIPVTVLPIQGESRLEKTFGTILVGDWLSTRLALELGTDPSPVPMVEELKRRLRE